MKKILNIKYCILVILLTFWVNITHGQQEMLVDSVGKFATIDMSQIDETLSIFNGSDPKAIGEKLTEIVNNIDSYQPPVLYMASNFLLLMDEPYDAIYLYYVAQLRAKYDANRCADKSARQALDVLNETYDPHISQFIYEDNVRLKKIISEVVAREKQAPHNYDHRWINLHGMQAMAASLAARAGKKIPEEAMSVPEEEWPEIHAKIIEDFVKEFEDN